jgi:prephenate dehydrogenase
LVVPGFNSTARLAATPSSMMLGILETNRDNVLEAISIFRNNLDSIEQAIRSQDPDNLAEILDGARLKRQKFL